jgi:hypothetical protein
MVTLGLEKRLDRDIVGDVVGRRNRGCEYGERWKKTQRV